MRGTIVALDSNFYIERSVDRAATIDTVSFIGIRRLEKFDGLRSRKTMVWTGAFTGAIVATTSWLVARSTARTDPGDAGPRAHAAIGDSAGSLRVAPQLSSQAFKPYRGARCLRA